jgi:hypothetical protein
MSLSEVTLECDQFTILIVDSVARFSHLLHLDVLHLWWLTGQNFLDDVLSAQPAVFLINK